MRIYRTSPLACAVVGAAAVLMLAACGGGDPIVATSAGAGSSRGPATSDPGVDTALSRADVAFITDMKPHHVGALMMAELAATRSSSAQVKDLAARIVAAQNPEIQTMDELAAAFGVVIDGGGSAMGGMNMGGGDMGNDVAVLEPLTGPAFDREFLARMTAHHKSAVKMAKVELTNGRNEQAKVLAETIITAQTKEIAEMKVLLANL